MTTRYRCGFPGCKKRYASTDGVRKHARKTHNHWLKQVDVASLSRDRHMESKPSTYCIMEVGCFPESSQPVCGTASTPFLPSTMNLSVQHERLMHMQRTSSTSLAAATSLLAGLPTQPPSLSNMPCVMATQSEGPGTGLLPELIQRAVPLMPDIMHKPWAMRPQPAVPDFCSMLARGESLPPVAKVQPKAFELDDPLCLTPPIGPGSLNSQCLSPFELEEKRPPKVASPPPCKQQISPSDSFENLATFRDDPPVHISEAEYADFVEALLAM